MQPTNSEILKNSLRVREKLWVKGVQKLPRLGAGIAVAAGGTGVIWRSSGDDDLSTGAAGSKLCLRARTNEPISWMT